MTPLHTLLARIRWDPSFGRGHFELAYFDRAQRQLKRVALADARIASARQFSFEITGDQGETVSIPYHRVREVWRDGKRIWQRQAALVLDGQRRNPGRRQASEKRKQ